MMELCYSVSDTDLTLWWDKPESAPAGAVYEVCLNGQHAQSVRKTHCTLEGLTPETEYALEVRMGDAWSSSVKVTTQKTPRRISVTDFGAVGDGKTLNTFALQATFDACGADEHDGTAGRGRCAAGNGEPGGLPAQNPEPV